MFDALVDDESSDASESNPAPSGVDVARLQKAEANSTMATAQARSENSLEGPTVPFSLDQGKRIAKHRALAAAERNRPKPRPEPKPYQCQSCFGRYKKREGLGAHWKRNPGCDPGTRRKETVSKETATEYTPGLSKSEVVAGVSSHMPKMQVVIEISSKEQTPEIGG